MLPDEDDGGVAGVSTQDILDRLQQMRTQLFGAGAAPDAEPQAQIGPPASRAGSLFGGGWARYLAGRPTHSPPPDAQAIINSVPAEVWLARAKLAQRGVPLRPVWEGYGGGSEAAAASARPEQEPPLFSSQAGMSDPVQSGGSPQSWQTQGISNAVWRPHSLHDPYEEPTFDRGLDGPADGGQFLEIGNPANPRLIREWEKREGRAWPTDPVTGRRYDVAHTRAIADGGTNTLDNIRPMRPDEHMAEHMANGDHARWAQRQWIARAFGGRVASVLGPLGLLSDALGVASGRIRTDTFDNFTSDLFGWPSIEDRQRAFERDQKLRNPNWKAGDPIAT
ncbi:MAG: repeat protein [Phenylobacterium sp.]|nr:repeat protein [Phenylobacterium sp.]